MRRFIASEPSSSGCPRWLSGRDVLAQVQPTDRAFPALRPVALNASPIGNTLSCGVRPPHSRATAGESPEPQNSGIHVRERPGPAAQAALLFPRCGKRSVLIVKIDRITPAAPVIHHESIPRPTPAAIHHPQPAQPSHLASRRRVSPKPGTTQMLGFISTENPATQRVPCIRLAASFGETRLRLRSSAISPSFRFLTADDYATCFWEIGRRCLDSREVGHHPRSRRGAVVAESWRRFGLSRFGRNI